MYHKMKGVLNMDVTRVKYGMVDPWVKKHPETTFNDFLTGHPGFKISHWSYTKRRRLVLNLPMTKSMHAGYRPEKSEDGGLTEHRSRSLYTSVWSTPVAELRKKDGVTAIGDFLEVLNKMFKLHLEPSLTQPVGSSIQSLEIRRYGR
jgi:hypothetical protein